MKTWLFLAAVNGALALLAGAFAAHGLKARLSPELLGVFDTGARYHMSHALAIGLAAALFQIGILLFCGSLYLLALTGQTAMGYVTPFGGVILLAGWLMLAWGALKT
jgi:uncharacterized membrane protein YgdD (TMEM256/DUF423 family)